MFLAEELQTSRVYVSPHPHKASSSRPKATYVHARLPCMTRMFSSDRQGAAAWTDPPLPRTTHPRGVLPGINHSQVGSSQGPEAGPPPAAPRTFSSTPSRARTARRRGTVARTGCTRTTVPPLIHFVQIVLLGLRNQNLRLLRQARHVRESRRPAARAHPRTRPSFVFQCKACVQMKHVCPLVSSAHASAATDTASAYFLFALYCSAPPAFLIFLQSVSWPPSFQCCTWHSAPQ